MTQFNFEAIGTRWTIDIYQELGVELEEVVLKKIRNRIDLFDKNYSRFRVDSLITKISKESGVFRFPDDARPLMSLYFDLYKRTNGLVTPLIGNLISDAGYDINYSLKTKEVLLPAPLWEETLSYNFPNLTVNKPVILDFGAAGKGYLIDIVAGVIESMGIFGYCVDAGGDIFYKNDKPLEIGLEDPENLNQVIGVCKLEKGSLCGSAGNRRVWGNFTHIINPKTLVSPKDRLAVWVTAETALLADALATCLFFVEPSILLESYKFEYVIVREGRILEKSPNFPGDIYTK